MALKEQRPPRVFISYSHEGSEHESLVLELCDQLRKDGINAVCDQYSPAPPEGWPRWMEEQISNADFVLVACTETYQRRVSGKEEDGIGKGVLWESSLIYQLIYESSTDNSRFIPVLLPLRLHQDSVEEQTNLPRSTTGWRFDTSCIPVPLRSATYYQIGPQFSLEDQGYKDLYRRLTEQPKVLVPILGPRRALRPINQIPVEEAQFPAESSGSGQSTKQLDDLSPHANELNHAKAQEEAPRPPKAEGALFGNLTEVSAVLGVVVNIIGVYTFVGGGTTATKVIFLAGIVWLLFFVIAIRSRLHRRTAAAVLLAIPIFVGSGFLFRFWSRGCPKDRVCVLVASFDSTGNDEGKFGQRMEEGLHEVKRSFPELVILRTTEFIAFSADTPLFPQDAKKLGASLVFWGDFRTAVAGRGDGLLTYYYYVLEPLYPGNKESKLFDGQVLERDYLNFTTQNNARNKAVCLTELVLGLSAFKSKEYEKSLLRLTAASDGAEAAGLQPLLPTIYLSRGRANANLGRFDQALADYANVVQLSPANTAVFQEVGRVYFSMGRFDEAIGHFDTFLANKPKDASALNDRGLAYLRKATAASAVSSTQASQVALGLAVADFSSAIQIDPRYAAAFNNRGSAHVALHQRDLALADFNQAVAMDTGLVEAYENRARVFSDGRDWQLGIDDFTTAINLRPNDTVAYAGRGIIYASSGDIDRAISDFTQVLDREPGNIAMLFNRGTAYSRSAIRWPSLDPRRTEALDKALSDFSQVIIRHYNDPKYADPNVYYNVGNVFMEKGETSAAIVNFGEAIKLNPNFAAAYYNRGLAYKHIAENNLAISDFKAASAKSNDDVIRQKSITELDALVTASTNNQ